MRKEKILENNLFGVDINPSSANICRLRLWIELLKSSYYYIDSQLGERILTTLPNIDINIKVGDSLLHKFGFKDRFDMRKGILKRIFISRKKTYKQTNNKQLKSSILEKNKCNKKIF